MKSSIKPPQKIECLNPNTGSSMNIDKEIYDLISKAIYHTLKKEKSVTFTELVEGIDDCFRKQKTKFDKSVGWYAVTVKHDMQSRGVIEVIVRRGRRCIDFQKNNWEPGIRNLKTLQFLITNSQLPIINSCNNY